jgi:hypothetical protein
MVLSENFKNTLFSNTARLLSFAFLVFKSPNKHTLAKEVKKKMALIFIPTITSFAFSRYFSLLIISAPAIAYNI